jgi:hypothetical protein
MPVARTSKNTSFTVPPAARVERLIMEAQEAERQSPMSRKEYRAEIERAGRYGATRAAALGVTSEEELNDMLYAERTKR